MEVIIIFKPTHYSQEVWNQHLRDGYKICKYLALPSQVVSTMDAETFLKEGLNFFFSCKDINIEDESCVLAKIFAPDGRAICLRADRDYFEVIVRDSEGNETVAYWQFCITFRDFRQDELWSNMVALLPIARGSQGEE